MVDLRQDVGKRWRPKALKRAQNPRYQEQLVFEIEATDNLERDFLPIYQECIVSRPDFRLDKTETMTKLHQISLASDYKLFILREKMSQHILGGVVFHLLPEVVMVAYRAYNHDLAKTLGLPSVDYYGELCFQNYVKGLGYNQMCHGSDRHPVTQLGLSYFKLSVGALPVVYEGPQHLIMTQIVPDDWSRLHKLWAYYNVPNKDNYYTRLNIFGDPEDERYQSLAKVAKEVGLLVECTK